MATIDDLPQVTDFERIVFFTGAGMSAASGVPTYRGAGGLWKHYDYQAYACQAAFNRNPEAVWEFHNVRRGLVAACVPNEGHTLIAQTEAQLGDRVTVVTQNIDGLHQLAGNDRVEELHGSLWRIRCDICNTTTTRRDAPLTELRCDDCGGWWRPDIVWFGDRLNSTVLGAALDVIDQCDLLVSIGTSAVVYPAAEMPVRALRKGATAVEINPEATPLSTMYGPFSVRATADEALKVMCAGL
ncbi:MAG: NAD-dependent deacylase [Myxococcota bacterium]